MSDHPDFGFSPFDFSSPSEFGFFTPVECGYPLLSPHWCLSRDGDPAGYALYRRHYSAAKNNRAAKNSPAKRRHARTRRKQQKKQRQFVGPGQSLVLLGTDVLSLLVWQRAKYRQDGQLGINCAVFRNEGKALSSLLIAEASHLAWRKWPEERRFMFVDAQKVRPKRDPARCFRKASWQPVGKSKGGLLILATELPAITLQNIIR